MKPCAATRTHRRRDHEVQRSPVRVPIIGTRYGSQILMTARVPNLLLLPSTCLFYSPSSGRNAIETDGYKTRFSHHTLLAHLLCRCRKRNADNSIRRGCTILLQDQQGSLVVQLSSLSQTVLGLFYTTSR